MSLAIKSNSTITIFPLSNRVGLEEVACHILSGSKIKVTLYSATAVQVTLEIYNSFSKDVPYRLIETLTLNVVGFKDFIINDFHNYFNFKLTTASSANCSVGISVKEDSDAGFNSNQELLNELNRLVPEFYTDAEVMAETAGKQPTLIEFRKDGIVLATIQITYVNEVFKRVQKL
jgi:hypothetical protein